VDAAKCRLSTGAISSVDIAKCPSLQMNAGQWPKRMAKKLRQKVFCFFGRAIRASECAYWLPLAARAANKVGLIVNTG